MVTLSIAPFRCVTVVETRAANRLSTIGPEKDVLALKKPKFPPDASARISEFSVGALVVMLIVPAVGPPEQSSLRPAQDFHAVYVDEIERRGRRPRLVHPVHIEADSGLKAVIRLGNGDNAAAEAANGVGGVARVG